MSERLYDPGRVLIEVRNLVKYFPVRAGVFQRVADQVQAVDDVSFRICQGETLGLVGGVRLWQNNRGAHNAQAAETDQRRSVV